jgi:hypothetical protein
MYRRVDGICSGTGVATTPSTQAPVKQAANEARSTEEVAPQELEAS